MCCYCRGPQQHRRVGKAVRTLPCRLALVMGQDYRLDVARVARGFWLASTSGIFTTPQGRPVAIHLIAAYASSAGVSATLIMISGPIGKLSGQCVHRCATKQPSLFAPGQATCWKAYQRAMVTAQEAD